MPTPTHAPGAGRRARAGRPAPDSRADFIRTLADALRGVGGVGTRTRPACWSRTWANHVRFCGGREDARSTPLNLLGYVCAWLRVCASTDSGGFETARAVVAYVRDLREETAANVHESR